MKARPERTPRPTRAKAHVQAKAEKRLWPGGATTIREALANPVSLAAAKAAGAALKSPIDRSRDLILPPLPVVRQVDARHIIPSSMVAPWVVEDVQRTSPFQAQGHFIHGEHHDLTAHEYLTRALGDGLRGFDEARLSSRDMFFDEALPYDPIDALDAAMSLSALERASVLKALDASAVQSPGLKRALRLALYDENAWQDYLDRAVAKGTDEMPDIGLARVLERMPAGLKSTLLKQVGQVYPTAGKDSREDFAPKRALDVFIRHALVPDQRINAAIAGGQSPKQAYEAYVHELQRRIFSGSEFGQYTVDDVLGVAREIQKVLRKQFPQPSKSIRLVLGGSFPNGRAVFSRSDIDATADSKRVLEFYPEMTKRVTAYFAAQGKQSYLTLEDPPGQQFTIQEESRKNPIQVMVSPSKIELWVWSPFGGIKDLRSPNRKDPEGKSRERGFNFFPQATPYVLEKWRPR